MSAADISSPLGVVSFAVTGPDAEIGAVVWHEVQAASLGLDPGRPVDGVWAAQCRVRLDADQLVETVLTIDLPESHEVGHDGAQWIVADLIEGPELRGHIGMPDEEWYASKYGLDLTDSQFTRGTWRWSYRASRETEIPFQAAIAWTSNPHQDTDALATGFALDGVFIPRGQ
jgi:hypothetical protein